MAELQRLAIALSQLQNQQIILTPEQQHYLSRVLRLQGGDRFIAMDGRGHWWLAELESQDRATLCKEIEIHTELPVDVTLITALPKGSGFDEVVRQGTELGVHCLVPVVSDRTLLKPSPQKVERWRRIAIEAAEQSERQIVPTILEPASWNEALENCHQNQRYICVTRTQCHHLFDYLTSYKNQAAEQLNSAQSQSLVIAIGPEGGWTVEEVERAIARGFQPVSLGNRIFRAVTAPIVALSTIGIAFER